MNAEPREFSDSRQAIPKCIGKPDIFPVWIKRFESYVSMSGCLGSLLADGEVTIGDATKNTQHCLSQYLSRLHTRQV